VARSEPRGDAFVVAPTEYREVLGVESLAREPGTVTRLRTLIEEIGVWRSPWTRES
jgi:hypothetical protein